MDTRLYIADYPKGSVLGGDEDGDEFWPPDFGPVVEDPLVRLRRDQRAAAESLSPAEVRYVVDLYYEVQRYRLAAANQQREIARAGEPVLLFGWITDRMHGIEREIRAWLDRWTSADPTGVSQWARSIVGIGPVLAAGLAAHIDVERAPTAGAVWRFAGLDPSVEWHGRAATAELVGAAFSVERTTTEAMLWLAEAFGRRPSDLYRLAGCEPAAREDALRAVLEQSPQAREAIEATFEAAIHTDHAIAQACAEGGLDRVGVYRALYGEPEVARRELTKALSKRPWNAALKTLCWKVGESFVKFQRREGDVYGHVYAERKALETARNEAGEYAGQARAALAKKTYRHDTEAYKAYVQGKLPKEQIHRRATRYAVKRFLADWHHVAYESKYGCPPPEPYPIAILGHAHKWPVPNHTCLRASV